MTQSKNSFQISIPYNHMMRCHELHLEVGNLNEHEAKLLAEALSDWLIEESGWKSKVQ